MSRVLDAFRKLSWLPLLALRVSIGFLFASGAFHKLQNLNAFGVTLRGSGIPLPSMVAPVLATLELIGGGLLVLGLGTKLSSAILAVIELVSLATTIIPGLIDKHYAASDFFSHLFYTPEWLLMGILAYFIVNGADTVSIDRALARG